MIPAVEMQQLMNASKACFETSAAPRMPGLVLRKVPQSSKRISRTVSLSTQENDSHEGSETGCSSDSFAQDTLSIDSAQQPCQKMAPPQRQAQAQHQGIEAMPRNQRKTSAGGVQQSNAAGKLHLKQMAFHKEKEMDENHMSSLAASMPDDFASAWEVAAKVGCWKRQEPKPARDFKKKKKQVSCSAPVAANVNKQENIVQSLEEQILAKPSQGLSQVAHQDAPEMDEIPLPKWCEAPASKAVVPPFSHAHHNGSIPSFVRAPPGLPRPSPDVCQRGSYLKDSDFVAALGEGHFGQTMLREELPRPGCFENPLKVLSSSLDVPEYSLRRAMPCKKRVPDWSF
jgi:hypothetical protein